MNKRICIVSFYFFETSIPLSRELSVLGNDVDLYLLMNKTTPNAFVFSIDENSKAGINLLNQTNFNSTYLEKYLLPIKNIYSVVFNNKKIKILSDALIIFKAVKNIISGKYDVIHTVGTSPRLFLFHVFFSRILVHSFHEYLPHTDLEIINNNQNLLSFFPKQFIFHSIYVQNSFYSKCRNNNKKSNVIKFGLFETYFFCNKYIASQNIEYKEILFLGSLRPYKGLIRFINIMTVVKTKLPNLIPVVAGSGDISEIAISNLVGFKIINKSLSPIELVQILSKSYIVVCPYLSASQSGIPLISYLYNIPVVSTDVGAMKEYIVDESLLGKTDDDLIDILLKLLADKNYYKSIQNKISIQYPICRSWNYSANNLLNIYNKL